MNYEERQTERDRGELDASSRTSEKPQQGSEREGGGGGGHDEDADPGSDGDGGQGRKDQEARRGRRPLVLVVAVAMLALLVLGGVYYWLSTRDIETTDDAYTDGYAENIGPQVAGRVVSLDVVDNQFVKRGQALIHIDPRPYIDDRDQAQAQLDTSKAQFAGQQLALEVANKNFPGALQVAQANLAGAKATLTQRQADYARQKSLPKQATTQQDVDSATSNLQNAQAQVLLMQARVVQAEPVEQQIGESAANVRNQSAMVEQNQAKLNQANLNLSYTVVRAAADGWVTQRQVNKGDYVSTGQQIMSLVSPDVWVTANFKETQLDLMRPGQSVTVTVDAYPGLDLRGHVDSIQAGSGSKFSAFPAENATGNFVKIVQRVPVKIVIDSGLDPAVPLPQGLSVAPAVTVR